MHMIYLLQYYCYYFWMSIMSNLFVTLQIHLRDHKEVGGVGDARHANCEQHLFLEFSMDESE